MGEKNEIVISNENKNPGKCLCGCPCSEFKKIMTSEEGLIVYVFTKECPVCGEKKTAEKEKPKDTDISVQTDKDNTVIVIQNTNDYDSNVQSADFVPEFDINKVSCRRCRYKMTQARKLLASVPLVEKKDILSVCDVCALKQLARAPCHVCQKVIRQFEDTGISNLASAEKIKKKILNYLTNAERILKTEIKPKEGKLTRSLSYSNIAKILERRDEYRKRLRRPKSGPVPDATLQYEGDLEPLNIILPEKKMKIQIDTHDKEFEADKIHTPLKILDTSSEVQMRPQDFPSSSRLRKVPKYSRGGVAKTIKSDTVLGVGTTGIMRRSYSDNSLITSFTGITEGISKRNLKYFFPRSVKKEFDALKISEDLIRETQDKFREEKRRESERKKMKQDEIRKRKIQREQEKKANKVELARKIELAKRQGIIPSDDNKSYEIDKKTGLLVEKKRPDRSKKTSKPLKDSKKGEKKEKRGYLDEKRKEPRDQGIKTEQHLDEKRKEKRDQGIKTEQHLDEKRKEKRDQGIKKDQLLDEKRIEKRDQGLKKEQHLDEKRKEKRDQGIKKEQHLDETRKEKRDQGIKKEQHLDEKRKEKRDQGIKKEQHLDEKRKEKRDQGIKKDQLLDEKRIEKRDQGLKKEQHLDEKRKEKRDQGIKKEQHLDETRKEKRDQGIKKEQHLDEKRKEKRDQSIKTEPHLDEKRKEKRDQGTKKEQHLDEKRKEKRDQSIKKEQHLDETRKEKRDQGIKKEQHLDEKRKEKQDQGIKKEQHLDEKGKEKLDQGIKKGEKLDETEGKMEEKLKSKQKSKDEEKTRFHKQAQETKKETREIGKNVLEMLKPSGKKILDLDEGKKAPKSAISLKTPKSKIAIAETSATKMMDAKSGPSSVSIVEDELADDKEKELKKEDKQMEIKKEDKKKEIKKEDKKKEIKKEGGKPKSSKRDKTVHSTVRIRGDGDDEEKNKVTKGHLNLLNKVLDKQDKIQAKNEKQRSAQQARLDKLKQLADKNARLSTDDAEFYDPSSKKSPPILPNLETKMDVRKKTNVDMDKVKVAVSGDDLVLKLISLRKRDNIPEIKKSPVPELPTVKRKTVRHRASQADEDKDEDEDYSSTVTEIERETEPELVYGTTVVKVKDVPPEEEPLNLPTLFQKVFHERPTEPVPEPEETVPPSGPGAFRYSLSDRAFITNGWTILPEEKIIRKMNIYKVKPVKTQINWFQHNKGKEFMTYPSGEKMATIDSTGHGRWFYKNGRIALDYYECAENNAQQRFVLYSSGEADSRGRTQPVTVLGMFDYIGNGVIFDHQGKIRLKYNQSEGVLLDRSIGPASHWKWHSLNDPPILQQVMIDTQLTYKDPDILAIAETEAGTKERVEDEQMVAIEFENFVKSKNVKPAQKFEPHQIKLKALKINDQLSLRILDQRNIYLHFREGSQTMKLNLGMELDHTHIIDTGSCELGEVTLSMEHQPAVTESIEHLQKKLAMAQNLNRVREQREVWKKPPQNCASAEALISGLSKPHRSPLLNADASDYKHRVPSVNNLYYNTRLM